MTTPERMTCILPDRTREVGAVIRRFSTNQDRLQKRIRQTLDFGDEGMSLSREFDCPSFYLEWVYKKLPPPYKKTFQQATLALLDSVAAYPKNAMSANSSNELLLTLHQVFLPDSPALPRVFEDLKKIISDDSTRSIVTQLAPDQTISLHMRAVQMFVGFDTKEPISFWNKLVENFGDIYAPLAMQGVFNFDFDSGVQWLIDNKNSQEVFYAFLRCLPYYYESKFGRDRCDAAIKMIGPQISKKSAEILQDEQRRIKEWLEREAKNKRV